MEWINENYKISNDKALLNVDKICDFLSRSYWAGSRSRDIIELSIENSICYGIYFNGRQVGFARVVTDYATMYWLCDVFIDEKHRGKELGKKLIQVITESEEVKGLMGILGTKDAHGLYGKYGFERDRESFMRKRP